MTGLVKDNPLPIGGQKNTHTHLGIVIIHSLQCSLIGLMVPFLATWHHDTHDHICPEFSANLPPSPILHNNYQRHRCIQPPIIDPVPTFISVRIAVAPLPSRSAPLHYCRAELYHLIIVLAREFPFIAAAGRALLY